MDNTSLPPIAEVLSEHDIDQDALLEALEDYAELSQELLYQQSAFSDPFSFLAVSDRHQVLRAFISLLCTA